MGVASIVTMELAYKILWVLLRQWYEFCLDNDAGFCLDNDTSFAWIMRLDFAYCSANDNGVCFRNWYQFCLEHLLPVLGNDVFELISVFLSIFHDFWCRGATSAPWGAPLGALEDPRSDFGAIWEVISEPLGVLGWPCGAILEPWMVSFGVFFAKFIVGGFLVAKCWQNCVRMGCPCTVYCSLNIVNIDVFMICTCFC